MRQIAITDGRLSARSDEIGFQAALDELAGRCMAVATRGVEHVLIREKRVLGAQLAEVATRLTQALAGSATGVLVGGPLEHALEAAGAAGACGVHLSASDADTGVGIVRRTAPEMLVTVSCHSADEVRAAAREGASAALFAPVFGKWVAGEQVVAGVGLQALREACAAGGAMPVFALGGVDEGNAECCVQAGAAGIAAIRMFFPGK